MDSAVVLVSGGLNSAVAAALTVRDRPVNLLHVDYTGHAEGPERSAVEALANSLRPMRSLIVEMPHVAQIAASPRDADANTKTPAETTQIHRVGGGLLLGLMPTLLDAAVQWAARIGATSVVSGASQLCDETDRDAAHGEGAPDYRREFYHAFNMMLETILPPKTSIQVNVPLIDLGRDEIVKLGLRIAAPLDVTWSCETSADTPCGQCVACRSRAKAFLAAGEQDPLPLVRT